MYGKYRIWAEPVFSEKTWGKHQSNRIFTLLNQLSNEQHRPKSQIFWVNNKQITGGFPAVWTSFQGPNGQMSMTLHIYRPRRFQWTWFGENRPSGCWVAVSAKFCPDRQTNERTDGDNAIAPHFFLRKGQGTTIATKTNPNLNHRPCKFSDAAELNTTNWQITQATTRHQH